jgi:hypothetical protein
MEEIKLLKTLEKTVDINLAAEFNNTTIDIDEVIERPPVAISIGKDDKSYGGVHYPLKFGSLGNFSVITGEEKSRKSFVKSLIESCTIGGKSNNYTNGIEIKGYLAEGKLIISIDGEQSRYDVWQNGNRIKKMVGTTPEHYKILMWREKSKIEKLKMLDWLFMESPYKDNLGLVMLDGFVDFVLDPNDQTEANIFTDLIMKYSSIANCHISGILHVNPNSDKMRGHLGTIMGQKAEMVMMVKNLGEYSQVSCKRVRGSKPFKDFTIRIDDEWMPYISDDEGEQLF